MNEILFEALKLLVLIGVFLVTCYLIPWLKEKVGQDRLNEIKEWTNGAVLMAQQVYYAKSGPERKAIVIKLLKEMLTAKNISITDDQLDILIESAVKAMKMEENKAATASEIKGC